jgi:hypothetical protein
VSNALRVLCPNEMCRALMALYGRGTFDPLRARIVFGRGGVQTLICTECGAHREWHTIPVERLVTFGS